MWIWLSIVLACTSGEPDPVKQKPSPPIPTVDTEDSDGVEDTGEPDDTGEPIPAGDPVTDSFVYTAPQIDVLFVLDASSSMFSRHETLKGSLDGLVTDWEALGFEFQAGVTNIDEAPNQGHLEDVGGARWADPTSPTPGQLLSRLFDEVGDPSSAESGRAAAYNALDLSDVGEPNEGFLRPGSQVAIIMHTDEVDQSGVTPVTAPEFVDYLNTLRPPGDVTFHSIVQTADYLDITASVGGVSWNVFNTPYGPALQAITDMFRPTLLVLTQPAIEARIVVRLIGVDKKVEVLTDSEWEYDAKANTVQLLANHPDSGATVEIAYETPVVTE